MKQPLPPPRSTAGFMPPSHVRPSWQLPRLPRSQHSDSPPFSSSTAFSIFTSALFASNIDASICALLFPTITLTSRVSRISSPRIGVRVFQTSKRLLAEKLAVAKRKQGQVLVAARLLRTQQLQTHDRPSPPSRQRWFIGTGRLRIRPRNPLFASRFGGSDTQTREFIEAF